MEFQVFPTKCMWLFTIKVIKITEKKNVEKFVFKSFMCRSTLTYKYLCFWMTIFPLCINSTVRQCHCGIWCETKVRMDNENERTNLNPIASAKWTFEMLVEGVSQRIYSPIIMRPLWFRVLYIYSFVFSFKCRWYQHYIQ